MTFRTEPLPPRGIPVVDPAGQAAHVSRSGAWAVAGTFLAANVLIALFAAKGWGFAVVLAELIAVAALLAAALTTAPVIGELVVGLVAVSVVVIIPFALLFPTPTIAWRTTVAGLIQLMAVAVLALRRLVSQRSQAAAPSPVVTLRWFAWPIAVLCGLGLGLVAHVLLHSPRDGSKPLSAPFWQLGMGGRVEEVIGVVVLGVAVEETLFRLLLAPLSRAALGKYSIIFDGALYATIYGASGSAVFCVVVLVAGTAAAWFRLRYGRMGPLLLAHALASTLAFVVIR